ncbi:MAG: SPOR domain-containing protein [Porticoccus sp.]|nr:SPOR domain-containing protein [Porticoccus sp.]
MGENLKQRFVGALVLIALAVIIIPLMFDFSSSREVDTQSQIPPRPEIKPVIVPEPVRPENIIPAKSDEEIFQFGVDSAEEGSSLDDETPVFSPEQASSLDDEAPVLSPEKASSLDDEAPVLSPEKASSLEDETPVLSPEKASSLDDETPALSPEGLPVAWVLQVGSFRDSDSAKTLLKNLLEDGYKAFVREKKEDTGTLSRIFVGPDVLKKKLVKEKTAIDKKYGVDAILVRFEP